MTEEELLNVAKKLDATHISCNAVYYDSKVRFFRYVDFSIFEIYQDGKEKLLHEIPQLTRSIYDLQVIVNFREDLKK